MSYVTNYNTQSATGTNVDIGTLFCDLTYDQTIAGIKTFSGTVIVNNSGGWTVDTSKNAVNKNYLSDNYAPIYSPVFTGTPKVAISGTNYPILTTNDLSGLNDVTFTGKLPYYKSGGTDASGNMATQAWVNSVLPVSFLTTWLVKGQLSYNDTDYYINTTGISTNQPTTNLFNYGIYIVAVYGLDQSGTPNIFNVKSNGNYSGSSFVLLGGGGGSGSGGSFSSIITQGGYSTGGVTPPNINVNSGTNGNCQYFKIRCSSLGGFPFYVAVTVCALTPSGSVQI